MSDFGELCPLFNTGVYNEVTFMNIDGGTAVYATLSYNMLEGIGGGAALQIAEGLADVSVSMFCFGRTVVVTDGWIQRYATNKTAQNLYFKHKISATAAGTTFATATITSTLSLFTTNQFQRITVASTTFTSSEVLGLIIGTITADTIGKYNIILRYREK